MPVFQIPEPNPITTNEVLFIKAIDTNSVIIKLHNRNIFRFYQGVIDSFEATDASPTGPWPPSAKKFVPEAIARTKAAVQKLGFSVEALYLDQPPKIEHDRSTEVVWLKPHDSDSSSFELRLENTNIVKIFIHNFAWLRTTPKGPEKTPVWKAGETMTPEVETKLRASVDAIQHFGETLHITELRNATFESIVKWTATDGMLATNGPVLGQILLQNGYWLWFRDEHIRAFMAPDIFFTFGPEVNLKSMRGKAAISERQAVERVRRNIEDLGERLDRKWWGKYPEILRPKAADPIPRLHFEWLDLRDSIVFHRIEAEIDTSTGLLKSLFLEGIEGI